MDKHQPKFTMGSLFICSKCGKDFSNPENADQLKSSLRTELKDMDKANQKIRVMVSGCLGLCESGEQAFAYYPNQGPMELYSVSKKELSQDNKSQGHVVIMDFLKSKLKD